MNKKNKKTNIVFFRKNTLAAKDRKKDSSKRKIDHFWL